ncbi:unnamed protein product, partial [Callosobruchus maculatus]
MTSVDFKKKTWQFHLPGPSGSGTAKIASRAS